MPITRAGLVAKVGMTEALQALVSAAEWLDANGCTPVIDRAAADAAALGPRWPTAARADLPAAVDVVLVFGGDGTLLEAAGLVAHSGSDIPLLGVNLGRLGFLTEVSLAETRHAFEALLAGRFVTESRLMLAGRVDRAGHPAASHLALNDIVFGRGATSSMIEVVVEVDGQFVCDVKADGLIVATATGSTAYNLSAGGPIVHPAVDAMVLTPIAPHTLTNRPLVLPASATLALRPRIDAPSQIVVTFDGQYSVPLEAGDVVEIRRAPRLVRLVRTSSRTHFDVLREKLQWGR